MRPAPVTPSLCYFYLAHSSALLAAAAASLLVLVLPCENPLAPRSCAERNPPIEEVIKTQVVPKFVEFLQNPEAPQLQVRGDRDRQGPGSILTWFYPTASFSPLHSSRPHGR